MTRPIFGSRALRSCCIAILLSFFLAFAQTANAEESIDEAPKVSTTPAVGSKSSGYSPYRSKSILSNEPPLAPPSMLGSKMINGAGFMLAVLLLGMGIQRHFAKQKPSDANIAQIEIVARRALNQKQALLVVEVNGQRLLIGQSSESLTMLSELSLGQEYIPLPEASEIEFPLEARRSVRG